ncbi:ammonium transporter Rh type A-like [Gastrophryne carolinensis]
MSIVFSPSLRCQLPVLLILLQAFFLVIFLLFLHYEDSSAGPDTHPHNGTEKTKEYHSLAIFPFFKDVQLMLFAGLGLLMAFMKFYAFGGMAFNFLIANVALQWSLVVQGFFYHYQDGKIRLRLEDILGSEFAAVTALISMGAVMGRTGPIQLLLLATTEVPLYVVNDWLVTRYFRVRDVGGTIAIHIFSCYFGLGAAQVLHRPELQKGHPKEATTPTSDLLSFLGTVLLWIFWPSFNAVMAGSEEAQHRAILNTFLALSSGVVTTFAVSSLVDRRGRISLAHLQNASLAGGVAIGISADLIGPGGAFAVGSLASLSCTLGFQYLSPFLARKVKLQDQCGIHNLHGLPAMVGIVASIVNLLLEPGSSLQGGDTEEPPVLMGLLGNGNAWTARDQALAQAAAFGVTFGVSLAGGYITGLLLRLPCFVHPSSSDFFEDQLYFQLPEDSESRSAANQKYQKPLLPILKHI